MISFPSSKRILIYLLGVNIVLIFFHLVLHYLDLTQDFSPFMSDVVRRFSMDAEASIPTWFTQILLFVAAQCFAYIAYQLFRKKKEDRWYWILLSVLALYMSIDEGAELHELLIAPTQSALGISEGIFFFAWIIPVLIAVALLTLLFARFFFRLDKRTRILLSLSALLFLLGAIGVEMISGSYWESQDFAYDFMYRIFNAVEEGLENTGIILLLFVLFDRIGVAR
jgi:hypothetical protein